MEPNQDHHALSADKEGHVGLYKHIGISAAVGTLPNCNLKYDHIIFVDPHMRLQGPNTPV